MKYSLSIFCFLLTTVGSAQIILENNPTSLKWNQVNTPHFRIIFPQGFEEQGQRMANTFEHIREAEAKSLGSVPRRLSVILQNQSSVSNGFVSMLPRRSEFYTMPSQDYNFLGTNDWLNLLAAHEYRHVVQFQHAMKGFNKAFYYLFGAGTFTGLSQAAAPDWFWEGDAVVTETAFTPSGRGKIPNFSLLFKTNLLEGRTFNYHKQYLRSYKHNIPNHYVLGYHMVSYLRKRTGDPEIWGKISGRAWSVPFIPFIFSTAIKRETGMSVTKLYREMAKDLRQDWQKQIDTLTLTGFDRIETKRINTYTDYLYPHELKDGEVLVTKTGLSHIAQFVVVKNNSKEEQVFIPGQINDSGMLSVSGDWIVWNEFGYDPRWAIRNYSLIKAYNIKDKKRIVVSDKKARFISAALSPDQQKLVAVRTSTNYQTQVVLLSFPDGKILKEFSNPHNDYYSMPRWADDGHNIVILKTNTHGKSIVIINSETGEEQQVTAPSFENTGYPVMHKNFLFFNSPVTGIDNIFCINLETQKRFQVTSSKYGAYNPTISKDGKRIYYNEQSKNGLDVVSVSFDPTSWKEFFSREQPGYLFEDLVEQEGHPDLFKTVPSEKYPVTRYSKARGLFNPYTWGAFLENDLSGATIGISSQDLLSTTAIDIGYLYNVAERSSAYRGRLSYQGLYPIIDVSATMSNRSVKEEYQDDQITFDWKETTAEAGIRIPLNTTSSKYFGSISFGSSIGLTKITGFTNSLDGGGRLLPEDFFREYLDNGTLVYGRTGISVSRLMKQARRDINSKWGQALKISFSTTPFNSDFDGELFSSIGRLYFPGLMRHHSFWFYGAYQHSLYAQNADNYLFQSEIPLPRGISVSRYEDFYTGAANYAFPIWYPDIAIGPLLNIQRLRANTFYDYGYGSFTLPGFNYNRSYSSVGVELKVDINVLRFLPQLDLGVRYTQGLDPNETRVEVIIGTFNF